MSKIRLTNRILRAILDMSVIAEVQEDEGDYQGADLEAMRLAGDWADEKLKERELRKGGE